MPLDEIAPGVAQQILTAALHDPQIRRLIRIDMSTVAGRAGVSTTSVRRYLRGEPLGRESATTLASTLNVAVSG
jgi:hypothetical protein